MGPEIHEGSLDEIPRAESFAPVYHEMLELVPEHLSRPVSVSIKAWEDGTFRIMVFHQIATDRREALYYHSDEDVIRYGIEDGNELEDERVVGPPAAHD